MIFPSSYDFYYKTSEEDRINLIGKKIYEQSYTKSKKIYTRTYYVVGLKDSCFNYGFQQGLIGLLKPLILTLTNKQLKKINMKDGYEHWFKIYAHSPDDLDLALHFSASLNNPQKDFEKVEKFMNTYADTFINTSYKEIFEFAQKELNMGEIGL